MRVGKWLCHCGLFLLNNRAKLRNYINVLVDKTQTIFKKFLVDKAETIYKISGKILSDLNFWLNYKSY